MGAMPETRPLLSQAIGPPLPKLLPTFKQLLARPALENPNGLAVVCMHQKDEDSSIHFPAGLCSPSEHADGHESPHPGYLRWTHAQLHYAGQVLARGLSASGVQAGQRIATVLPNCIEWLMLVEAAAILQCAFVSLNSRSLANIAELQHMLTLSEASIIVLPDAKSCEKFDEVEVSGKLQSRIVLGEGQEGYLGFKDLVRRGQEDELVQNGTTKNDTALNGITQNGAIDGAHSSHVSTASHCKTRNLQASQATDVAMLIFTSGTTSKPKGAIYTDKTITSSLLSIAITTQLTSSSRICGHMPNHHIGGVGMLLAFLTAGGSIVFPSAAFSPEASLLAVQLERCTNLPCVPAIVQAMADHPKLDTTDTSSLTSVQMGATNILPEHLKLIREAFGCSKVSNSLSATEGTPVTFRFHDATSTSDTVSTGFVASGASIKICAPDTRQPLPRGQAGEIHICGPHVIPGYLGGIAQDSFYEGWFITGDQGVMEENGELVISGRYKDMIIRGGENISPGAIEAVFDAKMGISAQVVGVPNDIAGEVPIAVLQPKKDQTLPDVSTIRRTLVQFLSPAFTPEHIYTLEDIGLKDYPRTSSGKVRKVDLKKVVAQHEQSQHANGNGVVAPPPKSLECRLIRIWSRVIGVDEKMLDTETHVEEFADSITIMRLRSAIQREMGVALTTQDLIQAGTIKQQTALLLSKQDHPRAERIDVEPVARRSGPPDTDDIAITLGDDSVTDLIRERVSEAISPFGFTWQDDVEDVLPSWDLGEQVFSSIQGVSKVNFRATLAMKNADVGTLEAALRTAFKYHAMTRSLELPGVQGATMRVILRPNVKWFNYAITDIGTVDDIEELTRQLQDGVHFDSITDPYPALQFKVVHLKRNNTAGLIWSAEHSAFDGLSLYSFLEDLDALLADSKTSLKAHFPYKPWADMYFSHRTSLAAQKAVRRHVRRLQSITSRHASIFPPPNPAAASNDPSKRRTTICDPVYRILPDLVDLKAEHHLSAFLLIKAALSLFLARKTKSNCAIFGQLENGRSWPCVPPWVQPLLPDCMDVAGPMLERSVQIIPLEETMTPLGIMRELLRRQDDEAADVHAPWNLVREGLTEEQRKLFDAASGSTLLNYIPVRTVNGQAVFNEMIYHGTRTNCDANWLYFCGIEGEGRGMKFWTRIFSVDDHVNSKEATRWAEEVTEIAAWMADKGNWERQVGGCEVLKDMA